MAGLFKNITKLDAEMILDGADAPGEMIEEGAAEELEVAEVGEELEAEQSDIEQYADGANDAAGDIEDLESLETELEASLEAQEDGSEGEGVNETTLASHRTTLSILRRYNGVDTSYHSGRITKQSYEMQNISSRDATRIVLAGIKDTIIAIWERIKAALKVLWDKVVKFWNKHLSAVGRLTKALASTRTKVKSLKGAPDYTKEHKAPSSFVRAFPTASVVDASAFKEVFAAHSKAMQDCATIQNDGRQVASDAAKALDRALQGPLDLNFKTKEYEIGSETAPLVSGFWAKIKFEEADNSEDDNKKYKGEFERETVEPSKDSLDMTVATKSQMETILQSASDLIKDTTALGKKIKDADKQYQKDIKAISDKIGAKGTDDNESEGLAKVARSAGQAYQFYNTVAPQVTTKVGTLNVQLGRLAIAYCKSCMSKYKKSKS